MAKLILKNLVVSFILILFVVAVLGMEFNVMGDLISMPFTWWFIGTATVPLTACLVICDYEEEK